MKQCQGCWEGYDSDFTGNEFFCGKCLKLNRRIENENRWE